MRILQQHFLFLIFAFQLLQMEFLKTSATTGSDNLTPKKQLMRFYRREFNLLAGEVCAELEIISEKILNDEAVQASTVPLIQDFQKNLTKFQNMYPYYVRFGLNESLATEFSSMVQEFYSPTAVHSKKAAIIKRLLKSSGYDALRQKYKNEFQSFFLNKFSNKFEQLKKEISNRFQMEKFVQRFSKCIEKAKECDDYECLLTNFRNTTLKAKDKFIGNVQRHMFNMFVNVLSDIKNVYERIFKHPKFSRFNGDVRAHLVKSYQVSRDNFEMIDNFYTIFHLGAWDILKDIVSEHGDQQQLITEVFEDCDYNKPNKNYLENFSRYMRNDFINEVENFKASVKEEGSAEDELMLDNIDRSSSLEQCVTVFMSLNILEISQLKKWRL